MSLKRFAVLVFLCGIAWYSFGCGIAHAQTPDAPSTVQPPAPAVKESSWKYLWDGREARTNREVFHEPYYVVSTIIFGASLIFDTELTEAGIAHHKCVEGNPYFGTHYPSRGHLYKHDAEEFAVVAGLGFLFTKARIYRWIPVSMAAYGSQVHFRGGASWLQHCW